MTIASQSLLQLRTPDDLPRMQLLGFAGYEQISRLFAYRVDFAILNREAEELDVRSLLGTSMTIVLAVNETLDRYFHGELIQCARVSSDDRLTHFQGVLVPRLSRLAHTSNCRIFQDKTIPEVISSIFERHELTDFRFDTSGEYEAVDYCVQYRESDLNFVQRLLEQEGIFFYFEHEEEKHTLILADTNSAIRPLPRRHQLRRSVGETSAYQKDLIDAWQATDSATPDQVTVRDFHFQVPHNRHEASVAALERGAATEGLPIYDSPIGLDARYNRADERLDRLSPELRRQARIRMEALEVEAHVVGGTSHCGTLTPGYSFDLLDTNQHDQSGTYVVTSVDHSARQTTDSSSTYGESLYYENRVTCIPVAVTFRPTAATPRPTIPGVQTATVIGPPGAETNLDRFGRIQVRFHWDPANDNGEPLACWVRVAQFWAGPQWGAHFWPRVGHEVVVSFVEGDPDRPLVTGSVYNAANMPPYALPANAHLSGIKTRSTPSGGAEHFNELRFNDQKDNEQVYIHAERELETVVEANERRRVGGPQDIRVGGARKVEIGAGLDGPAVDALHETIHGSQTTIIEHDDIRQINNQQDYWIEKGRMVNITEGGDTTIVRQGDWETRALQGECLLRGETASRLQVGENIIEVTPEGIELKVGSSSIKLTRTGVSIEGKLITVKGQAATEVSGGSTVSLESGGQAKINAGLVTIN